MPDELIWGSMPTAAGWYAVVVNYGRLPFPAARRWDGANWDDARGIVAIDGPHDSADEALDLAMERCPED